MLRHRYCKSLFTRAVLYVHNLLFFLRGWQTLPQSLHVLLGYKYHVRGGSIVRLAIVEDNKQTAVILEHFVYKVAQECHVDCAISRFSDAESFLQTYTHNIDLVFMDIQLPGISGMKAAQALRNIDAHVGIVFITSLAQFAIWGYTVGALDYIVKPFSYDLFRTKMQRIIRIVQTTQSASIMISADGTKQIIAAERLKYVTVHNHNVFFYTTTGALQVSSSLSTLQPQLEHLGLVRISANTMVNFRFITSIDDASITLQDHTVLSLSRSGRKHAKAQLTRLLAGGMHVEPSSAN